MKRPKVIYVNRLKCKCWDYKIFMNIYSSKKDKDYVMLKGAPILICIEGTYIELTSLINAVHKKYRFIVNEYVECILKDKPLKNNIIWRIDRSI